MKTQDRKIQDQENDIRLGYPIVGKSLSASQVRAEIDRLARNRDDVMIVGEAGVGKGAVAKNIYLRQHTRRTSRNRSCRSTSPSLDDRELEAILFGFDRGVEGLPYTSKRGSVRAGERRHRPHRRDRGGELPQPDEDPQLHQRAENPPHRRRDANETVDIRLIVTMKDVRNSLVEKAETARELNERIAEFEKVEIPPLRQRPEDIPLLVRHFARRSARNSASASWSSISTPSTSSSVSRGAKTSAN